MKFLLVALPLFVVIGCKTYSDDEIQSFDKKIKSYLKKKHITCEKSESGLYFKVLQEGKGDYIQYSDRVSFIYRGTLLNGTVVDQQKKPITFAVSELIAGWKEILMQSKPGTKLFLVIPPHLGYGTHELDQIPPNSVLVFDMEVIGKE